MFSGCLFFFHPELAQHEQLSRRAAGSQPGSFSGAFLGTELVQGNNWVILGCLGEAGRVWGGVLRFLLLLPGRGLPGACIVVLPGCKLG